MTFVGAYPAAEHRVVVELLDAENGKLGMPFEQGADEIRITSDSDDFANGWFVHGRFFLGFRRVLRSPNGVGWLGLFAHSDESGGGRASALADNRAGAVGG